MSKICKSCGSYYDGDYCTKCGYGKKIKSKALEKYKKTTKPVRFMTEQEKKEFYDRQRQKYKQAQAKRIDPHARRNTLIIIAVVAVIVIGAVLIQNGLLFSREKTDVINQYFTSISQRDFDNFVKCFPSEMKDEYEDERAMLGYEKEEYMQVFLEEFTEEYGEGFTISVTCGNETPIDGEYSLAAYENKYGSTPSISEAYSVVADVTFSGSKKTDNFRYNCFVGKVWGSWKLFNLEYSPGIIDPSMEIENPEQYEDSAVSSEAE